MQPTLLEQIISTTGALLVLGAYILNLTHRIDRDGAPYASMNLAGSGALGYVALQSGSVGLILIEFSWGLVSLIALVRAAFARSKPQEPR